MTETDGVQPNSYHEKLIVEGLGRPHIMECPTIYEPNQDLIDAANEGKEILEEQAFHDYFQNIETKDSHYAEQVKLMAAERAKLFPEAVGAVQDKTLQFVVPAYREGENMTTFLANIKAQFEQSDRTDWGVTVVMDHAIPYRNSYETTARKNMQDAVHTFVKDNPQYAARLDYVFYTRRKDTKDPVLPVGLARKVGEDVLMYERLQADEKNPKKPNQKPLYLGLMDLDTGHLSPGVMHEMVEAIPKTTEERAKVIRVRGSYDKTDVQENLFLHPLQMMWEGSTSEVGKNTKYNPFNVGRLSAVPGREYAMSGGGFARKLEFPDEDIRHGIQIAWRLNNIDTHEVEGRYSTSARREVNTVRGIMEWLKVNGGQFDTATMEIGALLRMYGDWSNNTYRKDLGNVATTGEGSIDPLANPESFNKAVPPLLIEALTNASYRFAFHAMYGIDKLSTSPDAPEIMDLKKRFLAGEIPHFRVELDTVELVKHIAKTDPERFERLKPLLKEVDDLSRASTEEILKEQGVHYEVVDTDPIYGLLEEGVPDEEGEIDRDKIVLRAPFKILEDQSGYMHNIAEELAHR
jgi:hypothetical protein